MGLITAIWLDKVKKQYNCSTLCNIGNLMGQPFIYLFFRGSATPCATPPPRPSIFSDYSFWVHHLVNRDDLHHLTHAMASDLVPALYNINNLMGRHLDVFSKYS
jgi:hypothetical protein